MLDVYKGSNWQIYRDSLAIGGVEGTKPVSDYFHEEKYRGKILAKSGSLTGVKALSGVCLSEDGEYLFSIITNNANWESRDAINDIVKAIIDEGQIAFH